MAKSRGWQDLRLISSGRNTFLQDYNSRYESNYGDLHPLIHVFTMKADKIFHFWTSELQYLQGEGQPRHVDMTWPLWNLFDLTPEGRGSDWYPRLDY